MGRKGVKLVLDTYGNYLGIEKGCLIVRDKGGTVKRYPYLEDDVEEVILTSGNTVGSGALTILGFWEVNVIVSTKRGQPIAVLKNLKDDSHVGTRVSQYRATVDGRGKIIARNIVASKCLGQNEVLRKYGLVEHDYDNVIDRLQKLEDDSPVRYRSRLNGIEGKFTEAYFNQLFTLIPEKIRPKARRTFHAYDGVNNVLNLGYELLFWRCYMSIIRAHLEAYLGFLHADVPDRPNLVCDLQEPYRYLIDDFLIDFCRDLTTRDFILNKDMWNSKPGGRLFLNEDGLQSMATKIRELFNTRVKVARVRNGAYQKIESLINEEATRLGMYLRDEKDHWVPRIASLK